jgi:mannan endo-1,4-beta-mannosidase
MPFASSITPANPNATEDAGKLLAYITSLPQRTERRLISGQHIGRAPTEKTRGALEGYEKFVEPLYSKTGQWPGMIGADYCQRHPPEKVSDLGSLNKLLTGYWRSGGLVTVCCHCCNPWTGGSAWLRDKKTGELAEPHDLRELTQSGSAAHDSWIEMLDSWAEALAELRDAGVVVLWRPFHEMTGNWFWWGQAAFEDEGAIVTDLWQHMFCCFSENHKLDNLLWVYTASNRTNPPQDFCYPGDDYTDVVGQDIYDDEISVNGYDCLTALPKPFCLGEFGPSLPTEGPYDINRLLECIKNRYPLTTSWLSWPSWRRPTGWQCVAIVECLNPDKVMNDPWVVTRESLDWR